MSQCCILSPVPFAHDITGENELVVVDCCVNFKRRGWYAIHKALRIQQGVSRFTWCGPCSRCGLYVFAPFGSKGGIMQPHWHFHHYFVDIQIFPCIRTWIQFVCMLMMARHGWESWIFFKSKSWNRLGTAERHGPSKLASSTSFCSTQFLKHESRTTVSTALNIWISDTLSLFPYDVVCSRSCELRT